jgi:hypothetical protein
MTTRAFLIAPFTLLAAPLIVAQTATQPAPTPPPVARALPLPQETAPAPAPQRLYSAGAETLIAPEAAQNVVGKFRTAYAAAAAPRVVIYVNRALVDNAEGMKLTGHTENYEKTDNALKTSGTNTYQVKDAAAPTLADQQTVREIERLVGRVFRNGGATLADQRTAAALLPEQAGAHLVGDQAAKDREALSKIADIAIEVLISSRNLTVPQVSGDVTYPVPDIQATAIRLKDAAIIGQATASDILGKGAQAGRIVQRFDVRDITEATALALMEDMLTK